MTTASARLATCLLAGVICLAQCGDPESSTAADGVPALPAAPPVSAPGPTDEEAALRADTGPVYKRDGTALVLKVGVNHKAAKVQVTDAGRAGDGVTRP